MNGKFVKDEFNQKNFGTVRFRKGLYRDNQGDLIISDGTGKYTMVSLDGSITDIVVDADVMYIDDELGPFVPAKVAVSKL